MSKKDNLEKELAFFKANQDNLVEQYNGKFLVIKDQTVIGVYSTVGEAYIETQKKHELGTFMIQQAITGEEAYTQVFHSQASFA